MKKHTVDEDVLILAIESSCDETAAAVVKNGRQVLSNIHFLADRPAHCCTAVWCRRLRPENT